jgi:hypothetical protein
VRYLKTAGGCVLLVSQLLLPLPVALLSGSARSSSSAGLSAMLPRAAAVAGDHPVVHVLVYTYALSSCSLYRAANHARSITGKNGRVSTVLDSCVL